MLCDCWKKTLYFFIEFKFFQKNAKVYTKTADNIYVMAEKLKIRTTECT